METIFTKIIKREIPSCILHEDDRCIVILDISPVNKGHLLIIAKQVYRNVGETPDDVLCHMICTAKKADAILREKLHCDGTNILINNDPASGQEVPHLHIHVVPRYSSDNQKFGFTKTQYDEGEMMKFCEELQF